MPSRLDPGIAVGRLDDLVGDELLSFSDHRVIVAAADEALDRKEVRSGLVTAWTLGRLADEGARHHR